MITCADAVKELWDFLDSSLDKDDRAAVEEHLAFCRRCCGELEFAEELRAFLQTPTATELPVDVHARLEGVIDQIGHIDQLEPGGAT